MLSLACQTEPVQVDPNQMVQYAERMEASTALPAGGDAADPAGAGQPIRSGGAVGGEPAALVGELGSQSRADILERIDHHVPDPVVAIASAQEMLIGKTVTPGDVPVMETFIQRVRSIERPRQVRLSLQDVIQRTLDHSFAIRVSSYNPAVETTRVVEAEAAFDTAFFSSLSNNKVDQPTSNSLTGSQIQTFDVESGLRKLLPTGMQVQTSVSVQRQSNNFRFQTINPIWSSNFATTFRQPLLRGFGLDVNRAQIRVSKLDRQRATYQFQREVRDTLRDVEQAYWRLVQSRRNLVVSARLLASFEQIYNYLDQRKEFDVYRIQLADTKARLERSRAEFLQIMSNVRNSEDRLISLMNDPELTLAEDLEIIPLDVPMHVPFVMDRVGEVKAALESREELNEAKLTIDAARVQVGVARNQALPQLDLTFRYTVDGLGVSADDAFDEVTKNDYHEYYIALEFELPVGNRARRAALRRATLQHAQSIAALKQVFEQVIFDVNVAVRSVQTNYDQIDPTLQSAEAVEDQVAAIIARAEKKDFLTLNNELNTRQNLASSRSEFLSAMVDYSIAIVDLERAKGTLLRYNNIDLNIPEDGPAE